MGAYATQSSAQGRHGQPRAAIKARVKTDAHRYCRTPGGLVPTARRPNAMPASSLEALEHWNVIHYAAGDILLGLV